ncbi:CDP-glucose 4,6-dehydratase-like protein [Sinorhizobium sojae CCBAU 05684]|uniref:CDP-glucose 4,6-dehydratase-like protein n=1 Tax=Sinorhizobium sojae CCBAU 05684 TaxID=716928 RepID=A0A249PC17_9HYPH|nr:CDP-glucose 4,6-dehydratase [Sinorhizobium sojae]ASY63461.1 CDP-glucose 4,6-dehydratase-like protein [Sinorhizobium sojae CCBAU 05684]
MESLGMKGFWRDKRVLLTGHTGFKGSWLALWLSHLGAKVYGCALEPHTSPSLFRQLGLERDLDHIVCDIRDGDAVAACVRHAVPDVVLHLAAQPIVRRSYREPLRTWQTNVIGTANLLESLRSHDQRCAAVIVTSDKVYENREWFYGYRETDTLGGHDPYSTSKAAAELAVATWRNAVFGAESPVKLASARAGNVIGGGDWAEDRLIPDIARSLAAGETISIRNSASVRPWQHVLESLSGYLLLAQRLYEEDTPGLDTSFNFGPEPSGISDVETVLKEALRHWPGEWQSEPQPRAVHEAAHLSLSIDKARTLLGWSPRWDMAEAVRQTMTWYRAVHEGADARALTLAQIGAYADG